MTARSVTYGDLDALLRRLGFTSRPIEVTHRDPDNPGDTEGWVVPAVLYHNAAADDAMILLPPRPLDEPAEPQHLIPTRRQLIERGLIEEDEFERWLCAMRFGDVCREPAATGAADGRTGRDATG